VRPALLGELRLVSALAGRVESASLMGWAMELALAGRGGRAPCSAARGIIMSVEADGGREAAREGGAVGGGGTIEALTGRDDETREALTQSAGVEVEAARLRWG
jgi:hypothetical protein